MAYEPPDYTDVGNSRRFHFGLVLFIPWRAGADESGAAKKSLGAATGWR